FFSSRRRHTRFSRDWSSDVCSSDLDPAVAGSLPPISILDAAEKKQKSFSPESLEAMSRLLEIKLKEFGVEVVVESVHPGPVITQIGRASCRGRGEDKAGVGTEGKQ